MMNRLYLVRHGENLANLTKEFSYRLVDYSLTPKGRLQAEQTAAYFCDRTIHAIYSSPLKRARETAEIIGTSLGLPVRAIESFREVNVGLLETLPPSKETWGLHNRILADWLDGKEDVRFPGGENYHELCARMRSGMRQITHGKTGCNLLVVAHGGIFTFTLRDLCPGVDLQWLLTAENHNCSISELLIGEADGSLTYQLVRWADYSHLHGEASQFVSGVPRPDELK